MSSKESEYHFKCNSCGEELIVIPSENESLEDFRPGPYCEQCGEHRSYELLAVEEPLLKLYWVETEDHAEDWFIVSYNEAEAEVIHENEEGYGEGDAEATLVCELPEGADADKGWPSFDLLEICGAIVIRKETPRVVEIGGRRYCEGMLDHEINQINDELIEEKGGGRPNRTKRRTLN